jgi:predicted PurR-regulated permease PerM
LNSDVLAKSAACSLQIVGVCVHIQSRADSDNVNGMIAMVMIVMMIAVVMVNIVPEALNQVDSVCQHLCKTFQQLIDFHWPNASHGDLNFS